MASRHRRRPFRAVLTIPAEGRPEVALAGELDVHAASQFREALLRAMEGGAVRVVVDLSRVTFIDSTALGVLVGGVTQLRTVNGTLDVICPNQEIRRIFEVTGLDHVLAIYASSQDALRDAKAS